MTVRRIVQLGDPALRLGCPDVPRIDRSLWSLLDDMRETMRSAEGVGLAANQIGRAERVCVIEIDATLYELIDPRIERQRGEQRDLEGCLSVDGFRAPVTRAARVRTVARDRDGRRVQLWSEGLLARAIQHEVDHLDGRLYIDHLGSSDELMDVRTATSAARAGVAG